MLAIFTTQKLKNSLDYFESQPNPLMALLYSNHSSHYKTGVNIRWTASQLAIGPSPLVLTGPSGSGKSTLLKRLMDEFEDCFGFSISHTTRQPRSGEVNGREYYFISHKEFEDNIEAGDFIEYTKFSNNYYGTSKRTVKDVQKSGKICILDVEIEGVKSLKNTDLNPRFVFIKPPNMEILESRLRNRNTESEEAIQKRLKRAIDELEFCETTDTFDLSIVNDSIDEAYNQLRQFILQDIEALKLTRGM